MAATNRDFRSGCINALMEAHAVCPRGFVAVLLVLVLYILADELRLTHHVQLRRVRQLYLLEERIVRPGVVTRRVVDVLHAIARADAR